MKPFNYLTSLSIIFFTSCTLVFSSDLISKGKEAVAERNFVSARHFFENAGQNPEAQFNLGIMYEDGEGVPKDNKRAFKYYQMAANNGYPEAQYNIAMLYASGLGVGQDYDKAFEWLSKAAKQDLEEAQYNIGLMYLGGIAVKSSDSQAVAWFKKSKYLDDANYNLALMYISGNGSQVNKTAAFNLLKPLAHLNRDLPKYNLGVMYLNGFDNVKPDFKKAFKCFMDTSSDGISEATYNLALMYIDGKGVKKNLTKAFNFMSQAANNGYPDAQYNLAMMYDHGLGVKLDKNKAKLWLAKADNLAKLQTALKFGDLKNNAK